ncbi:hypothetical protein Ahy_B10g103838 [Arachis hypogaea]|uniref:Uncharacterized protein n=1 Tax=Arachis hypogaea TaxID=3818 RepID=A0A444X493_ARAHY|nr:hypothetical protein Ahy_B10g103838 [Arachis hypogaea]
MTSYSEFIAQNMGKENEPVTEDEHVAFLFYLLNAVIFCYQSVQMQKLFLPLVGLLHEGNMFNLAKLLLGHLFEELGYLVNCLRNNSRINKDGNNSSDKQHIEGFQLASFPPNFQDA